MTELCELAMMRLVGSEGRAMRNVCAGRAAWNAERPVASAGAVLFIFAFSALAWGAVILIAMVLRSAF